MVASTSRSILKSVAVYLLVIIVLLTASTFHFQSDYRAKNMATTPNSNMQKTKEPEYKDKDADDSLWTPTFPLEAEQLVNGNPQMAKDVDFATAVIQAHTEDVASMIASGARAPNATSETRPITYIDPIDGTQLYGHLIRSKQSSSNNDNPKVPGILFFHTGAGPHDVSLQWKADLLATNQQIFPNGCVVLVTDILSDQTGWGWDANRTRYNTVKSHVLASSNENGHRPVLQSRIRAAVAALQRAAPNVDVTRLAALGWCLGGHSILEWGGRMMPQDSNDSSLTLRAMITFHGVFDGVVPPPPPPGDEEKEDKSAVTAVDILLCHGALDPFVNQETVLQPAVDTLKQQGHRVRVLVLPDAKHGFSNPAQDYNPNPNFRYNKAAAHASWEATLQLLQRTLGPPPP